MKAAVFAFTQNGIKLAEQLIPILEKEQYEAVIYTTKEMAGNASHKAIQPNLQAVTEQAFQTCRLILFIGALGIAVRAIAPFVKDKTKDPAVVCMDDGASFVIPVLSGHIGGANQMARIIAESLGATPVITTATDVNGMLSVDEWAVRHQMRLLNGEMVKTIAKSLLSGKKVGLLSDFKISGILPNGICLQTEGPTGICISLDETKTPFEETLHLIPAIVAVGIGCRKDTPLETIEEAVFQTLKETKISRHALFAIGSIDLKKNEKGLLQFAENHQLPLCFYTGEELMRAPGRFTSSAFVRQITQADNVCERAAVLASKNGRLIKQKTASNGVTVALAAADWSVPFDN